MRESFRKEIQEWSKAVIFAVAAVLLIKLLLFDIVAIDGISMEPMLYDKDRVFVNILEYKIGTPKRQDLIVFTPPVDKNSYFIKRVIGIPGDTVKISGGTVYVNNNKLNEIYLAANINTAGDITVKVPDGMVFVLGDNRNHSEDSRFFGPISISSIKGHAIFRVFPLSGIKGL
jgi:signal peptidase I